MSEKNNKTFTFIALILILALGAFLRLYRLGAYSIGNSYYAATVKSMLMSPSNFFFGAFEPGGSVTVDKPPLGFWIEAFSATLFGLRGFSLALPNALAGIGSIALVYYLVKKQVGVRAGLVSALTLAVIPVTVSTERNNTIDGMLVFVLLLASLAVWKSLQEGKSRYLLLGMFFVGLGFNIKMLQAYMILPALYALYFFGANENFKDKFKHLVAATLLLVVVSLSWAVIVDLTPAEHRPFIGSSETNSVLELIIGHNGLARLGLSNKQTAASHPQTPPNPAPARVPPPKDPPPPEALAACKNLTPNDVCTVTLPEQRVQGICLPLQQSETLFCAPADARLPSQNTPSGSVFNTDEVGTAGIARLWQEPLVTEASWILPLALLGILVTALRLFFIRPQEISEVRKKRLSLFFWSMWLFPIWAYFSFTTGLFHRYYLIMLGPSLAALTGMAFDSLARLLKKERTLGIIALCAIVLFTLGFQASVLKNYASLNLILIFAVALALLGVILLLWDKKTQATALGIILLALLAAPFTWSVMVVSDQKPEVALPTATIRDPQENDSPYRDSELLSPKEKSLLAFLLANTEPESYLLATLNARRAAPFILETGRPVLTFGGFKGSDPIIDAAGVAEMIANGELRYILFDPSLPRSHPDIAAFITESCLPVSSLPGWEESLPEKHPSPASDSRSPSPEILYDCAPEQKTRKP
jgi:4-amino-4-deoxy-L-arabinose transferase-like glycosyltransferase